MAEGRKKKREKSLLVFLASVSLDGEGGRKKGRRPKSATRFTGVSREGGEGKALCLHSGKEKAFPNGKKVLYSY